MYINTNIVSLNAQANLANSQSTLATDIQRLSSGLRINSAADDAAGMAIATRMGSQIAGQNQAVRNANDGISLSQTAQGAMQSIVANLQTMRDLAVQSANATYSASDRASMNAEVQQLKAEIDRVAGSTTFNGVNLLDGTFTAQNFQVGANNTSNDSIQVASIANMHTSQLGSAGSTYSANVSGTATTTALNAGDVTLNGFQVGASQAGAAPGQTADSAYAIAQAINAISANSSVTATANATTVTGTAAAMTKFTSIAANTFSINGINVGAVAAGTNAQGQGANLAAAINLVTSQTGVSAVADAATGVVSLTASDGRNISIAMVPTAVDATGAANAKTTLLSQTGFSSAQVGTESSAALTASAATAATGTASYTTAGSGAITGAGAPIAATLATIAASSITLAFDTNTAINLASAVTLAAGNTAVQNGAAIAAAINATIAGSSYKGLAVAVSNATTGVVSIEALSGHKVVVTDGATADTGNIAGTADATGGAASTKIVGAAPGATATATVINNLTIDGTAITAFTLAAGNTAAQNGAAIATAINAATGSGTNFYATADATTGIVTIATYAGNATTVTLGLSGTAADLTTATANQTAVSTATGFTAAQLGLQAYSASSATTGVAASTRGTVSLTSTSSTGIVVGGAAVASAGLSIGSTAASTASSINSIKAMDVSTAIDASNAIATIDGAINTVNSAMGQMGAVQNRFQSVVTNLQTSVQNLTAAQSRIQDTDFAATTASLTQAQILQQAGTAMLAQANAMPNAVLTLLK
jgi:flagellin